MNGEESSCRRIDDHEWVGHIFCAHINLTQKLVYDQPLQVCFGGIEKKEVGLYAALTPGPPKCQILRRVASPFLSFMTRILVA